MHKRTPSDQNPRPIPQTWDETRYDDIKSLAASFHIDSAAPHPPESHPSPAGIGLTTFNEKQFLPLALPNFPGTSILGKAIEKNRIHSILFDQKPEIRDVFTELKEKHEEIKSAISTLPEVISNGDHERADKSIAPLLRMPQDFRHKAFCKLALGITRFGKIPIRICKNTNDGNFSSVAGDARPMGCPEAAPEGSVFILAWREGDWWNWDLPRNEEELNEPALTEYQDWQSELGKYLVALEKLEASGAQKEINLANKIRRMFIRANFGSPMIPSMQMSNGHGNSFLAGIMFAKYILYRSANELYTERDAKGKKSEWPDIVRHALDRHGWETKADSLRKKIHLNLEELKTIQKSDLKLFSEWPYLPDETLTLGEFSKKLQDVKSKSKPKGD